MNKRKRKGFLVKVIESYKNYFSLDDIKSKVRGPNLNINRVTIYRNLKKLLAEGKIKEVVIGRNKIYYELVGSGLENNHHHHIICLSCRNIIDFKFGIFEFLLKIFEFFYNRIYHFKVKFHNLDFYGCCQKCYNKIN